MKRFFRFLTASGLLLAASPTQAQLPNTDLEMIAPAYGKAGTSVEVVLTGREMEEITCRKRVSNFVTKKI